MKLFIVSIALVLCSVSGNPTPQLFGYQPATPVGQWVSSSLQNSLQSVANAIQSISRPSQGPSSQIAPNQIPNGPETYGPVVQPVPVQPYQPGHYQPGTYQPGPYQPGTYQPGPYQPGPYQPGPYQPGPYQPGPYEQIHVIPVPPPNGPWPNGGIPYRNGQIGESKSSNWMPLPVYYQFGEPSIIIISRPPSRPAQQNETAPHENSMNHQDNHPTNSTNMQTDGGNTTTNFPQNEQNFTSTTGKND